jgi:hypothetical protein
MNVHSIPPKQLIARHNQLLRFSSNGQPLERSQVAQVPFLGPGIPRPSSRRNLSRRENARIAQGEVRRGGRNPGSAISPIHGRPLGPGRNLLFRSVILSNLSWICHPERRSPWRPESKDLHFLICHPEREQRVEGPPFAFRRIERPRTGRPGF